MAPFVAIGSVLLLCGATVDGSPLMTDGAQQFEGLVNIISDTRSWELPMTDLCSTEESNQVLTIFWQSLHVAYNTMQKTFLKEKGMGLGDLTDCLVPKHGITVKHSCHAFVTWVILNSDYVAGALVLGASLRFHSPGILRICLLSKDRPKEDAECLARVYHHVVWVDLVFAEAHHHDWGQFESFYAPWINYSFTRIQCLRLKELFPKLETILMFDADTVVLSDVSGLFDLEPPAGILSLQEGYRLKTGKVFHHADYHGQKLSQDLVDTALMQSYGIRGSLLLLRLCISDFDELLTRLRATPSKLPGALGVFGEPKYLAGPDEVLFTTAYQMLHGWTHIHQQYLLTAWHQDRLAKGEEARAVHFVSTKPWNSDKNYDDFMLWFNEASKLVALDPTLRSCFSSDQIRDASGGSTAATGTLAALTAVQHTAVHELPTAIVHLPVHPLLAAATCTALLPREPDE